MARTKCKKCGKKFSDSAEACPKCGNPKKGSIRLPFTARLIAAFVAGAATALAVLYMAPWQAVARIVRQHKENPFSTSFSPGELTYGDLLAFAHSRQPSLDVAEVNLLCAQGLPGVGDIDIPKCLDTISKWSDRVREETSRRHREFKQSPERFDNSEIRFRLSVLADALRKDAGLYYDYGPLMPKPTAQRDQPDQNFFKDPRNVFIHGILMQKTPPTSLTLSVIVAAVGRRQGYPLKLANAKNHGFVRWDDGKERINIEVTSQGLLIFPDEKYRDACLKGLDAERQNTYLESFTPSRELAVFFSRRAACLAAGGRPIDAEVCWAHAWELNPDDKLMTLTLRNAVHGECAVKLGSPPPPGVFPSSPLDRGFQGNDFRSIPLRDPRKRF